VERISASTVAGRRVSDKKTVPGLCPKTYRTRLLLFGSGTRTARETIDTVTEGKQYPNDPEEGGVQ